MTAATPPGEATSERRHRRPAPAVEPWAGVAPLRRVIGVGVDCVRVERVAAFRSRYDDDALGWLFRQEELSEARSARDPERALAERFAAKEAVGKALGIGLGGLRPRDVGLVGQPPAVVLAAHCQQVALSLGITHWVVTRLRLGPGLAAVVALGGQAGSDSAGGPE
jgi:holo-[acyl-carrier protein] synthase